MAEIIDVRGLSCPEPVLRTLEVLKKIDKGEIEVWVDTNTSKENIIRAVNSMKCEILEIKEEENIYKILVKKE